MGVRGGELLRHARAFPHACFPAAVPISYHGGFSKIETGARREISHRTSHQSPASVCVDVSVCSTFGLNRCGAQFRSGFLYHSHGQHHHPQLSAHERKCEPIISAAKADLFSLATGSN